MHDMLKIYTCYNATTLYVSLTHPLGYKGNKILQQTTVWATCITVVVYQIQVRKLQYASSIKLFVMKKKQKKKETKRAGQTLGPHTSQMAG